MEGRSSTAEESIPDEHSERPVPQSTSTSSGEVSKHGHGEESSYADNNVMLQHQEASEDDDWEAVADRPPEELLPTQSLPSVSNLSLEDSGDTQRIKRRGRGTFYYGKEGLYSDDLVKETAVCDVENTRESREEDSDKRNHLAPPRQRPQTSAGTARRLIAQGMGIKLPSTYGSTEEFKKQEEARKNRIVSRQIMREDAWGGE